MTYTSGTCWSCRLQRPVDRHHIIPLELGGDKDGKQILLCKSCHSVAHYEAEHYYAEGSFKEIDSTIPENTDFGVRIRKVIQKIVDAKTAFSESDIQNDQRRMSQISWDSMEELQMAHEVKTALRMRSLERAIKFCVYEIHKALQNKGKL